MTTDAMNANAIPAIAASAASATAATTATTAASAAVTALVADDEEAPREQLLAALRRTWPALHVVASAANGVDAWDAFLEHNPQVCFLDIRMPGLSGVDVARRIAGTGSTAQVVFATAHGDHALAAFDAGAMDYLLKPVDDTRLAQTVARLQGRASKQVNAQAEKQADKQVDKQVSQQDTAPDLRALLDRLAAAQRRAPLQVLQAAVGREVRLIRTDEIVYFESDARYTRVVFDGPRGDGQGAGDALIRTPLKELLAQLDDQLFWQVHRAVIVNHRHIASAVRIDEGHMQLILRGRPERLPVSRHFQGLFKGQ